MPRASKSSTKTHSSATNRFGMPSLLTSCWEDWVASQAVTNPNAAVANKKLRLLIRFNPMILFVQLPFEQINFFLLCPSTPLLLCIQDHREGTQANHSPDETKSPSPLQKPHEASGKSSPQPGLPQLPLHPIAMPPCDRCKLPLGSNRAAPNHRNAVVAIQFPHQGQDF